jgi:peptidylglycine monooxygenase
MVAGKEKTWTYAWGAPSGEAAFSLPHGMGFEVGGDTGLRYIVIGIHYEHIGGRDGYTDHSGHILTIVPKSEGTKTRADTFATQFFGTTPAHSVSKFDAACDLDNNEDGQDVVIHPMMVFTHLHWNAVRLSMWKVSADQNWTLIDVRAPTKDVWEPVLNPNVTLTQFDTLAIRCTMNNTPDKEMVTG